MQKIKNFSLHPIKLSDELKELYEILEPEIDKKKLILATDNILSGKCTMIQEQQRLLNNISPYIESGDIIYVAGHPIIVLTICMIASIKGAKVITGLIDLETKEIKKIEEIIYDYKKIDREFRMDIEYNKKGY